MTHAAQDTAAIWAFAARMEARGRGKRGASRPPAAASALEAEPVVVRPGVPGGLPHHRREVIAGV